MSSLPTVSLVTAAALVAAGGACADIVTCPSTSLWDIFPRGTPTNPWDVDADGNQIPSGGQGWNGITLSKRPPGSLRQSPLTWANWLGAYWTWADPNGPSLTPQIYATEDGESVFAHPNVTANAVITVTLTGPGGSASITGTASTLAAQSIVFEVYVGATSLTPIWTGVPGQSFGLNVPYATGDVVRLETRSVDGDVKDWAIWRNVRFNPARSPDIDGNGIVGGPDLGIVLGAWGACSTDCEADLDCTGNVDAADLALVLGGWSG